MLYFYSTIKIFTHFWKKYDNCTETYTKCRWQATTRLTKHRGWNVKSKRKRNLKKVKFKINFRPWEVSMCSFRFQTQLKYHFAGYLLWAVMGMCQWLSQCFLQRYVTEFTFIATVLAFTKLPRPEDSKRTFWSSIQAANYLPHTVEASYTPFYCWTSSRKAVNTIFYCVWFGPTRIQTRAVRFNSRHSIHSTTDQFNLFTTLLIHVILSCQPILRNFFF